MLLMDYCTAALTSLLDSVSYIKFIFGMTYYSTVTMLVKLAMLKSKCSHVLNSLGQSWEHVCDDAYCYYNYIETRLKMQMGNFWPHDINKRFSYQK